MLSILKSRHEIIYGAYTDSGSRGGINQDAILTAAGKRVSVFCLADGMGGHSDGELASNEIISCVRTAYEEIIGRQNEDIDCNSIFSTIEQSLIYANTSIWKKYNKEKICGSTVVLLAICDDCYALLSAGDSRAYRLSGMKFCQMTKDDVSEDNHKLTKAVGVNSDIIYSRTTGKLKNGDLFLLCSDGVYKVLGDRYLKGMMKRYSLFSVKDKAQIEKQLRHIKAAVVKKGALDNHSVIMVCIARR